MIELPLDQNEERTVKILRKLMNQKRGKGLLCYKVTSLLLQVLN